MVLQPLRRNTNESWDLKQKEECLFSGSSQWCEPGFATSNLKFEVVRTSDMVGSSMMSVEEQVII
jgi:hypothetical protein